MRPAVVKLKIAGRAFEIINARVAGVRREPFYLFRVYGTQSASEVFQPFKIVGCHPNQGPSVRPKSGFSVIDNSVVRDVGLLKWCSIGKPEIKVLGQKIETQVKDDGQKAENPPAF